MAPIGCTPLLANRGMATTYEDLCESGVFGEALRTRAAPASGAAPGSAASRGSASGGAATDAASGGKKRSARKVPRGAQKKKRHWKDERGDSGALTEKQYVQFCNAGRAYGAAAFAANAVFQPSTKFPTVFSERLTFNEIAAHRARLTEFCRAHGLSKRKVENLADALRELSKLAP